MPGTFAGLGGGFHPTGGPAGAADAAQDVIDCLAECPECALVPWPLSIVCCNLCLEGFGLDDNTTTDTPLDPFDTNCPDTTVVLPASSTVRSYAEERYYYYDRSDGTTYTTASNRVGSTAWSFSDEHADATHSWSPDDACPHADNMYIDDQWVTASARFTSFRDPAHEALEWLHLRAPATLTDKWSSPDWAFDDPSCDWLYIEIGRNGRYACTQNCTPPDEINPDVQTGHASFLVSAIMPYAVYEAVQEAPLTDSSGATLVDEYGRPMWSVRMRVWVGFTHHFSFFVPPDGENDADEYTTDQLPSAVWDTSGGDDGTGGVASQGVLAWYWTSLTATTYASATWHAPGEGITNVGAEYPCSLGGCPPPGGADGTWYSAVGVYNYGDRYEMAIDGTVPSPLSCSNPEAMDDDDSAMTSFLGQSAWGEVCFVRATGDWSDATLAAEAFQQLFGDRVMVGIRVEFIGGGGSEYGTAPHHVERFYCVKDTDLQTVESLTSTVDTLRSTPEGRWLFRNFDSTRLTAAVKAAKADATTCCEAVS